MCKYEMDPTSIVEDTEWTRFCPQTDKVKPVYPPFVEARGIIRSIPLLLIPWLLVPPEVMILTEYNEDIFVSLGSAFQHHAITMWQEMV